jgi:hypothetical protein
LAFAGFVPVPTVPIEFRALSGASAIDLLISYDPRFKHSRAIVQNKSLLAAAPRRPNEI